MQPDILSPNQQQFDGIVFNRDSTKGYYTSSRKIDGHRVMLHRYIWEKFKGPIPKGCHVHHIDHDKDNNRLDNLQVMTHHDHLSHHAQELQQDPVHRQRNLEHLNKVRPKAAAWHSSPEGLALHRKNGKAVWDKHGQDFTEHECKACGKAFKAFTVFSYRTSYCSNACKSAGRRQAKADNIIQACVVCGSDFESNRYKGTVTCGRSCGAKLRWQQRRA